MSRQQGLALVLVLWMLTLLSIMAGSFALSMRRETAIIVGLKNNAEARAIAEAGIGLAELMLLNNDPSLRWQTDGRIYEMNYAGARVRVRLLSETGKIDINIADETQLQELLSHAEIDDQKKQQIANAILDWRDGDDFVHLEGAEKKEYQAAGLKYAPSNKPFQSVAELQMVLGMDEAVFNWLEPLITVYSKQQVDVKKASREVLQVLNLEDPAIDKTDSEINSGDSTNDRPAFENNPFAAAAALLSQGQQDPLNAEETVTIVSEAMIAPDMRAALKAVVRKSSGAAQPFQILNWQADVAGHGSLFAAEMDELLDTEYAESRLDN